jgi:hypothetical protein
MSQPYFVVHREQIGSDEVAATCLLSGSEVLPAGNRATAPFCTTQAHCREVVDGEVAHCVVEGQFLPGINLLAGDNIEGLLIIEAHTAVGVT